MPKNSKSGDSYLSCILLIICNWLPANITITPLLSNESYSCSHSLSLPSYSSSLPSRSTPPLLLIFFHLSPSIPQPNTSPHKSSASRMAALCPILSSLSKRMTGSIHEVVTKRIHRYIFNDSKSAGLKPDGNNWP